MEVTYRNELKDIRLAFVTLSRFERLLALGVDTWLCVLLGIIPGAVWLTLSERWLSLALGGAGVAICIALFVVFVRRSARRNAQDLKEQTLRLEPEWFEARSATSWTRRRWSAVRQVSTAPGGFVIGIEPWMWFVIPSRAFSRDEEMQQFASLAQKYFDESRLAPTTSELTPPDWFDVPTDVFTITYQATRADHLKVLQKGAGTRSGQEPAETEKKPAKPGCGFYLASVVLLAGMLLIMDFGKQSTAPQRIWQAILFLLSCFLFWFVGLMLLQRFRAHWAANKVNPSEETLTLTTRGCLVKSAGRLSFLHWEDVKAILFNDATINFQFNAHVLHIIPKRAFASPAESEEFIQRCHEYWSAAHADPANPVPLSAYVVETGNPYQSPQS